MMNKKKCRVIIHNSPWKETRHREVTIYKDAYVKGFFGSRVAQMKVTYCKDCGEILKVDEAELSHYA